MVHEGHATIRNRQGMHVRPAGNLAKMLGQFQSNVSLTYEGTTVNAKSPVECLMLGAPQGSHLVIKADGPDAVEAVNAVLALIENRFGMDDND